MDSVTKRGIAEFICGDGEGKYPIYRSSQKLTQFFKEIGINAVHDGTSRNPWTYSVIERLNGNDLQNVILRLASPKLYTYNPAFFQNTPEWQQNRIDVLAFFGVDLFEALPSKLLENPQSIGEHLKRRRQELKLWQKDVAAVIGVSEDSITYWENERSTPLISHYPKIIQFLGYNPFPVDTSTLAGRIKKYRIEAGLSQEDLASLIGVDESTIFHWEKGTHRPLPSKRILLEKIINKSFCN